jgi:ankyrin repeat protein
MEPIAMNHKSIVLLSVFLSSTAYASYNSNDDQQRRRHLQSRSTTARTELTRDDELRLAVTGYKSGAAVLVGMFNPLLGLMVAASPSSESPDDLKNIQSTVNAGANINHRDHGSWTPLMHAAYGGHPNIVQELLSKGANRSMAVTERSFPNWEGYTPLMIAKHYVERYQKARNSPDCKPEMHAYYDDLIARYSQIVGLLSN